MGLFDTVRCHGPDFVCSEGHSVDDCQTKDLGCTMGVWDLCDNLVLASDDDLWGEPVDRPFTGTIDIYGYCIECPAFVQAGTANLCPCPVEFSVQIVDDAVVQVVRTSPSTAEWLKEEPTKPYMEGCLGPMSYDDAHEKHMEGYRWVLKGKKDG